MWDSILSTSFRLLHDNTFFHWCSLLSENTCFLSIYTVQVVLKYRACIFLCEVFVLENKKSYTAEQVADMIEHDDIGEMEPVNLLDEKSSSSSSDNEPSS